MRKSIFAFIAAALWGVVAVPAAAENSLAAPAASSVTISFADLNLTSPAGNQALHGRINRALDQVCAKPNMRELKARQAFQECATTAREGVKGQLSLAKQFQKVSLASNF